MAKTTKATTREVTDDVKQPSDVTTTAEQSPKTPYDMGVTASVSAKYKPVPRFKRCANC